MSLIKATQTRHGEAIFQILNKVAGANEEKNEDGDTMAAELQDKLPLKTMEELKAFEEQLRNSQTRKKVVSSFSNEFLLVKLLDLTEKFS